MISELCEKRPDKIEYSTEGDFEKSKKFVVRTASAVNSVKIIVNREPLPTKPRFVASKKRQANFRMVPQDQGQTEKQTLL